MDLPWTNGILYLMVCWPYMYLCFPKPFRGIMSSSVGKISGTLLFDCNVVLKNRCDKKTETNSSHLRLHMGANGIVLTQSWSSWSSKSNNSNIECNTYSWADVTDLHIICAPFCKQFNILNFRWNYYRWLVNSPIITPDDTIKDWNDK